MKRLLVLILALLLSLPVFAHSGRTDSKGGHNGPGGYHYHHGYPAHQHEGGECPYDFDDRTGESSGTSSSSSEEDKEEPEEEEHPFWAFLKGFFKVVLYIFLGLVALFLILGFFSLFVR